MFVMQKHTVLPYHSSWKKKTQNPEQHWGCFNMGVLTEISQSLWSYGVLDTYTNVQILPFLTMCPLNPALMVLFTSGKMVERTGEGADRCNSQGGSAVLYCICSDCAASIVHLSDNASANILSYLPLEFLKSFYILLPPQFWWPSAILERCMCSSLFNDSEC